MPIIFTTLLSLKESKRVIAKNTKVRAQIGRLGKNGAKPTSYVVAAVLGIAKAGPIQMIAARVRTLENPEPTRFPISTALPPAKAVINTVKIGITGSARRKPNIVLNQPLPALTPRYGGNIKFPAPKNIAKSASPLTKISFFLLFKSFSL